MNHLRTISIVCVVAIIAFAIWAAGPPPGTYVVPAFMTTNNARLIGTNGIGVSSNINTAVVPSIGTYVIDGSSLSNSIAINLSNKVDELNGVATNLTTFTLLSNRGNTTNSGWVNNGGPVTNYATVYFGPSFNITANGGFQLGGGTFATDIQDGSGDWLIADDGSAFFGAGGTLIDATGLISPGTDAILDFGISDHRWKDGYFSGNVQAGTINGVNTTTWLTLTTASNAFDFNPNQFTRTGTGGTNINISSGSLQTNNNFYGTTSHIGVQTNTGAINTAGVSTNWNDVYMRTNATMALNQASKWPYEIPDLAITTTNATGGLRFEDFFPNPTRRRFAMLLVNASAAISWFGEANANSGTLAYETPTTNLWWTVSYATSASANADAGGNTTSQAFSPGQNLVWDWVGRIDAIGTNNVRHWIGLTSTTLANMNGTDTPTTRSVAAVRFSQSVPDTEWKFVTCDGSACTVTTSTTAATTNLVHFKLVEDYANARWIFFLNGVPAATNSANLPIATMGSIMSVRTLINKAYIIRTSMMSCFQSDKQTIMQYP